MLEIKVCTVEFIDCLVCCFTVKGMLLHANSCTCICSMMHRIVVQSHVCLIAFAAVVVFCSKINVACCIVLCPLQSALDH